MKFLTEFHRLVLALILLGSYSLWLQAGEPTGSLAKYGESRSWSNDTGQFRIDGKMQTATDKEVTILKADNRVIKVPFDKLSAKDQQFISEFLKAESEQNDPANPFAGGQPANPFAGGEPAPGMAAENSGPGGSSPSSAIRMVRATTTGARPITVTPVKAMWETKAPLALPETKLENAIITVGLPNPTFASLTVKAGGRTPTVVMNSYREGHKPEDNYSHFVVVDPVSQQSSPLISYSEPWKMLAMAPNGTMMAAVRVIGFDKGNDLAIFAIEGNQLRPMYQFTAGGGDWDELYSAAFLPGNRLATLTQKKNLTIWSLDDAGPRALFRGTGDSTDVVYSPAGELMIVPAGKNIAVIDTTTLKLVGCLERDTAADALAISPDGKFLAAYDPFVITVYSMDSGAQLKQFPVSEGGSRVRLDWVGKYIMLGDIVYDFERELPIWSYSGRPDNDVVFGDYVLSGYQEKEQSTLTVFKIPHDSAITAAANVDPKSIYAMIPGDGIKLTTKFGNAPANVQQEAQKAAQAKIDELGWVRLDNAVTVMEISIERQEQKSEEYYTQRGIGPFLAPFGFGPRPSGPAEKVTFTPWKQTLTIRVGNNVIYSTTRTFDAPRNIQIGENETAQAAISRIVQPDGKFFQTVKVPPYILRPEFQGGVGKSSLSARGLK